MPRRGALNHSNATSRWLPGEGTGQPQAKTREAAVPDEAPTLPAAQPLAFTLTDSGAPAVSGAANHSNVVSRESSAYIIAFNVTEKAKQKAKPRLRSAGQGLRPIGLAGYHPMTPSPGKTSWDPAAESGVIALMMRSRSSSVAYSMMILPLWRPCSTLTRVS